MNALFEQIRSTVDRLSGLAQALGDTPVSAGRDVPSLVPAHCIEDAFTALTRGARLEVLEVRPVASGRSTPPPAPPPAPPSGVRHRLIADPRSADAAAATAGRGTEIRTAGLFAVRALVADREALALAVGVTDDSGYLLSDPRSDAAAGFAARFMDDWWPRAHPYAPFAVPAESATEAAVMAALAQGLTDETVARRVGVTPRTVRRHVAAVSARFGATSRLQLGVLIGRAARETTAAAPETPLGHG
ncbi:helix-turn-helix transcriptional regulator [Streptomyces actuosus]|uniref:Helix-turn-helix transcriptional regulator n=1 Tax=Streptomyces actuosus TaxID=1885 RepID=A0ABS2VTP3_STRAS|nr:helix-turn-helix transcriptional regulator [Streptomyces actuosus]MBN0046448.1 helix-turn-helix transcriptional regulator [Streptomyces actuosus]